MTGGGMNPLRVDRAALLARTEGWVEPWIVHALLDAYEPALLDSLAAARKRKLN